MPDFNTKAEKIASALYLITSFFDDKEPLKWKIRSIATDFVSERIKDKSSISKEALSLFSMAKMAGLVSEMNYSILNTELSTFAQEVNRPLDLTFLRNSTMTEKALPKPQPAEHIKDNIIEKPILHDFGVVRVKKNSRQSIIMGILKRKKEIMIKDVSPLVSGCSEKTIQRELSSMVHAGVIKRVGEKRWSRYSLALQV